MKSLKRTLSLVLVLVMVLGLFGVASAAFTDEAKIQYKVPVGVMTGMKAINGYPDGSFNPTGNITRAEAAKLVAYTVLGAKTAAGLTGVTSRFTDVGADYAWAIPSIEYLASRNIINGIGGGLFDPEGNVTGYELGKMLLVALGYGAKNEYVGEGWDLQVAIDASKKGIYDGRAANANKLSAAASREESALYCFNTLFIKQAKYVNLIDDYTSVGLASIAEDTYGYNEAPGLVRTPSTADAFGRPATKWFYKNAEIATVTATPIRAYTTGVKANALFLELTNAGFKMPASGNVTIIRNGNNGNSYDINNAVNTKADIGGNGIVTEIYADAVTKEVNLIVQIITYLGKVTITAKDNAATTTVNESAMNITYKDSGDNSITVSASAIAKTPGFAEVYAAAAANAAAGKETYALVIPHGDNTSSKVAMAVALPKTEVLTATSYIADKSFVAGGQTYTYAETFKEGDKVDNFKPFTAMLDAYGYVIGTNAVSADRNYAVVLAKDSTTSWGNTTHKAMILKPDGTTSEVIAKEQVTDAMVGNIVTYTVNTKGQYEFTAVGTKLADKALEIKTGSPNFTFDSARVANSKTIFLVATTDAAGTTTYKAYAGFASVPGYSNTKVNGAILEASGISAIVYLNNPTATGTVTGDKVFVSHIGAVPVTTASGTYYVANVVVNGEIKTMNLAGDYEMGVYTSISTNDAGIVTLGGKVGDAITTNSTVADGIVTINGTVYAVSPTCAVFTYDKTTGELTSATTASVTAQADAGTGYFTIDSTTKVVTAIYFPEA